MQKNSPKRSESGPKYLAWMVIACFVAFIGAVMAIGGSGGGAILFLGGIGMAMRETSLRWKAKKWMKEHE